MNPYDFVRIDWSKPPKRERPIWHNRLFDKNTKLYSGQLEVDIIAETPLFIFATEDASSADTREPARFAYNAQGNSIIPGSTLKGMIRTIFEALGSGCLTLFDGTYKKPNREDRERLNYWSKVPDFQHCDNPTQLCIACRTFGMLRERSQGVFLGKVNIGDAVIYEDKVYTYNPIYTKPLMEPKPYHTSFYLDEKEQHIAGRKFYFHHSPKLEPLTENGPIYFGKTLANRYIEPLDYGSEFHFRVDFTNLTKEEFNALLQAIVLDEKMRHKIGYGKPLGLGTIELRPTRLTLIDYATRYSTRPGTDRGKTTLEGDPLWDYLYERLDEFATSGLVQIAMDDLARIWRWPPEPNVAYHYPDKRGWFDTKGRGKRIADTRYA